jgi:hypothetical protein
MSTVKTNNILDASGGNTATINSMTPTADSLQGFRNRIINGDMRIDQRNAGASVTPTGNAYTIDRWAAGMSQASKFSVQRSTTAPTGFINSALITSTSAYSVTSTDRFAFSQFIEGLNCTDLGWGTASAKTMTLSFQVRSSLTGTFGGAFQNNASDRSYPFTYTISAANTWETKTVTVAGDITGTWLTNNEIGIQVRFSLGTGSTYSNTAGAWVAGDYRSATGATSVVGTNGATFYITGVQLEVGSVATPFERRPYGTELALCQRYYYRIKGSETSSDTGIYGNGFSQSTTAGRASINFPVTMRSIPSALEQSGTASHYRVILGSSGSTVCSAVPTFNSASVLMGDISWTVASGATGNQGVYFASNNASSYLAWSAEL